MSDEMEGEGAAKDSPLQNLGSSVSRRTLLGGAALAIGGAALAACSTSSTGGNAQASGSSTSLLQTIQSRGTLNVVGDDINIPHSPRYVTAMPRIIREVYEGLHPEGNCRVWVKMVRRIMAPTTLRI